MLLYNTRKFDVFTCVLDPSSEAPSRMSCNEFTQGDLLDFDAVYNFGKQVDVLTIEIEKVNVDALEKLENEGVKVYPSPSTLKNIQNKAVQKFFYLENGGLKLPFVWKSALHGYDGTGVKIVRSLSDLESLPKGECIAEELIPFKKELSVIVARNIKGEVKTFPVVEMEFHPEANQVEYVICPARIEESIAKKAELIALKTAYAFKHVGLLAVELFLTQDDEILINEVAPRPHNSGHQTIEANYTSQFEQHSTENKTAGIMVNLVGKEGHNGDVVYKNIEDIMTIEGVTPHIYGKKVTRPFRKMGHVTIVHKDVNEARKIAEKVKNTIEVISK